METEAIFWICLMLVSYSYLFYPVCIWLLTRWFARDRRPPEVALPPPKVALLIAAHNEAQTIEAKIRNSLALDYPPERLEIVIVSDGSSDATVKIAQRFADPRVRVLDYHQRRGKSAALNAAITQTDSEILVLTDANTNFKTNAVRNLVRWFAAAEVNVVCGRLILTDPKGAENVDSLYWRYETFLKKCEGRLDALLGANGAIYAIRREVYVPIPDNTIIDDFVIPLLSKLRHGGRIIYDLEAIAREETPPTIGSEFWRRARIGTGAYQSLAILWPILSPRYGFTAFAFFSHKVLRWVAPFMVIGMLATNVCLMNHMLYQILFAGQISGLALAAIGAYVPGRSRHAKALRGLTMLAGMNVALFVGFWRWLFGRQTGVWQRTARSVDLKVARSQ